MTPSTRFRPPTLPKAMRAIHCTLSRTMDMMLTGRTYGAEEGAAIGLSQYVVDEGQGLAQGIALAKQIIANAPLTNFAATQVLPRIAGADPETGLLMESLM